MYVVHLFIYSIKYQLKLQLSDFAHVKHAHYVVFQNFTMFYVKKFINPDSDEALERFICQRITERLN